jgi:type IV secretory pathway VirJ component
MKRSFMLLALLVPALSIPALLPAADQTFDLRGKALPVAILKAQGTPKGAVLFLPGDGGWRGIALNMGHAIADMGYDVYGFDTKKYLEAFSGGPASLSEDQMKRDMRALISWTSAREAMPVTIFGWSQGAGMGVLAAAEDSSPSLNGVITLGLPRTAVLGWNWRDMLAAAARMEPNEPFIETEPLLRKTTETPIWMIYGSADEYTNMAATDRLFAAANEPKHIVKVPGANHRFDSRTAELNRALQEGLAWISQDRVAALH